MRRRRGFATATNEPRKPRFDRFDRTEETSSVKSNTSMELLNSKRHPFGQGE